MPSWNQHQRQLDQAGYLILPGVLERESLTHFKECVDRLFLKEGEDAGAEFRQEAGARRLANLVNKRDLFGQLILHRTVREAVQQILGNRYKLSSLNARSVPPRNGMRQPLHCDMGALPDACGFWVCNCLWLLDDFRHDNGSLRVVPGTHLSGRLPGQVMNDPRHTHPREKILTAPAGSVIVMNSHLWHGGLENRSDRSRTAIHAFFCRRDKPQQQYQKELLSPGVQDVLSDELRELLALDDPENDRLSRSNPTTSGFLK